MGIIRVLPEAIANKIAAGEVVERPASVVKELVENAIDAGANEIEVEIQSGGKSLIRVSDNGSGMSREDAELAFKRHATSKLTDANDLFSIGSFGFRGEALPSISAVSRVRLVTARKEDPAGTEIVIDGGYVSSLEDSPLRRGTSIEVRDLFFNTPARRKFLKTDSTEMGHVMDTVAKFAFSHLNIHFIFRNGEKIVFDLLPGQTLLERAGRIYGEAIAKHLIPVEGKIEDMRVTGLVGKPFVARANRSEQTFFVNHRWVRALSLSYAVQDGFEGLLMHGQYPIAVVAIEVDPGRVDVNVHPTKHEVRISNEPELRSFVKKTVGEALRKQTDLAPHLRGVEKKLEETRSQAFQTFLSPAGPSTLNTASGVPAPSEVLLAREPEELYEAAPIAIPQEAALLKEKFQAVKILGQIHNTFIVVETEEGLMLVDQHAAHERVMFEALLANLKSGKPEKQSLLLDEILEVHPRQAELLKKALPFLDAVGFEIDVFGENTFIVRTHPSIVQDDPVSFLKKFLDEKEEGKMTTDLDRQAEDVAALVACKRKSVKAHDALTPEAMRTLLTRLAQCENPFACPHGRPSFLQYSFYDLERQFKRK